MDDYSTDYHSLSESELTDTFITSDSDEDVLNWDSGDSRPPGPSPPSTPRVLMNSSSSVRNYARRLRPRRRVAQPLPPETQSQSRLEISEVSQVSGEPAALIYQQGEEDSDADSDETVMMNEPSYSPTSPSISPTSPSMSPTSSSMSLTLPFRSPTSSPVSPTSSSMSLTLPFRSPTSTPFSPTSPDRSSSSSPTIPPDNESPQSPELSQSNPASSFNPSTFPNPPGSGNTYSPNSPSRTARAPSYARRASPPRSPIHAPLPPIIAPPQPSAPIPTSASSLSMESHPQPDGEEMILQEYPRQSENAVEHAAQPTTSRPAVAVQVLNSSVLSEGEEGSICLICMDPLTNSGSHRVVCLKCGHIFGQACVERWIKVGCNNGAKRCPTCNKKASLKDIRVLFFSKVVPLDTVEKDRLIQEKELISRQKKAMEMELNRCKLQCEMNRKQYQTRIYELQQQYEDALKLLNQGQKTAVVDASQSQGVRADLLHTVELSKEGGCRVLSYCPIMKELVVSQPTGNTVFAGFGVRVLNTIDFQPMKFVFLHQKMIRDLAFHAEDRGILLSVSLDQTAKLVDLGSKCTIHTFKSDGPLWSGCWDATNPHLLLVGTQVGKVFQYDRRMLDTHVNLWEEKLTTPVVSLVSIPSMPSTPFPQGGFFSCRLNGVYAYARTRDTYKMQLLPLDGPFMSMKYNYSTQTLLTKTRPSSRCPYSMINMSLVDTDEQNNICLPQIHSFNCGSYAHALTRFSTMQYANDMLIVGHHQSARTVNLWSSKTGDLQYSFPAKEPVIDIECINQSTNKSLLVTLSEKKVNIYKVT